MIQLNSKHDFIMKPRCLSPLRFLPLTLLAFTLSGQAQQDLPYDSGSTGADGPLLFKAIPSPGKRNWHALTYDGARQELIMFGGGSQEAGRNSQDTWALAADGNWVRRADMVDGRYAPAMTFDAARGEVVVFGGEQYGPRQETFVWNGTNWIRRSTPQTPPSRYHTRMVYDSARQNVVLFGGYNNAVLGDTWIWNGTNWNNAAPSNAPSARYAFDMVYDSAKGEVILFAGYNGTTNLSDTWVWNGTNWAQKFPQVSPPVRSSHQMAYDSSRNETLLFGGAGESGLNDTWVWNGSNWFQRIPAVKPPALWAGALGYDQLRQRVVLFGGWDGARNPDATWLWDGGSWSFVSSVYFDMRGRSNGLWNFTSITVPGNRRVEFIKNAVNSPVKWLASSNVVIDGTIELSGQNASGNYLPGTEARGGPGGFDGGLGGRRFNESGSYSGTPGQGPGGGAAGVGGPSTQGNGQSGESSYINTYLQPLIGGSGGGGSGSSDTGNGNGGGGGGGAILISSSRDITVNGVIRADGGSGSGQGSGGAIRLVGDRVTLNGNLYANGGPGVGRIRVEAFYRNGVDRSSPTAVSSVPVPTQTFETNAALLVTSVAGQNVVQPPGGSTLAPDVIFTQAGPISITVQSVNVPDGSPVTLRVTTSTGIINKPAGAEPPVILTGGVATFTNIVVPKGIGTVQASASFTVNAP